MWWKSKREIGGTKGCYVRKLRGEDWVFAYDWDHIQIPAEGLLKITIAEVFLIYYKYTDVYLNILQVHIIYCKYEIYFSSIS